MFFFCVDFYIQDAISSKTRPRQRHSDGDVVQLTHVLDTNNTEIVILSDTVRQRRARTPSANDNQASQVSAAVLDLPPPPPSPTNVRGNTIVRQQSSANVLPDLLPTTFRLAESSSLFSQISDTNRSNSIYVYDQLPERQSPEHDQVSVVAVRESDLMQKMSVRIDDQSLEPKLGEIVNTISILESVDTFEPEYVETVHIIDASETSDTDTCSSTPVLDDGGRNRSSFDDLEDDLKRCNDDAQYQKLDDEQPHMIIVEKQRIDTSAHALHYRKERDLLNDYDQEDHRRMEAKIKMKKSLVPNLKEILCTPERDSFYNSDKENNDEPLVFSDDEDIPRFSLEMTPAGADSDSDTVQFFFCYLFYL